MMDGRAMRRGMNGLMVSVLAGVISACGSPVWTRARAAAQSAGLPQGMLGDRYPVKDDPGQRRESQNVAAPWLAGRATGLARDAALPEVLQGEVETTLLFAQDPVDLPVIAERIQRATGIAVRVKPDALLPASHFVARLDGAPALPDSPPARMTLQAGPAPLPDILDAIAAQMGVYWRYQSGQIEFYRVDVRVFRVRALSAAARADARLGRLDKGEAAAFGNTSNTSLQTGEHHTIDAVVARLQPFLTRAGVVAAHGSGDAIVVSDTVDALDRIGRFLDAENRMLTRRVRLVFEEVTVDTQELQRQSIDWQLLYRSAARVARFTAPGAVADSFGLVAQLDKGPMAGSAGIVQALNRYATVLRHTEVPLSTINRRPVTHAVRTTFSYVDRVQRHGGSDGRAGSTALSDTGTSISQKEETVGVFLTVIPDVFDDSRILLSIAYDNTVAHPLKTLTFGKGERALSLQQVTIDGSGTVQQVEVRAGQPMLVAGFNRIEQSSQNERFAPGAPLLLGGRDEGDARQVTTLVFVTAQIDETGE